MPPLRPSDASQLLERGVALRVSQGRLGPQRPRATARDPPRTPPTLTVVPVPIATRMAALCPCRGLRLREVADVLRRAGHASVDRVGQALRPRHRRALEARLACRADAWGGQR
jgi:hypothetical protein